MACSSSHFSLRLATPYLMITSAIMALISGRNGQLPFANRASSCRSNSHRSRAAVFNELHPASSSSLRAP